MRPVLSFAIRTKIGSLGWTAVLRHDPSERRTRTNCRHSLLVRQASGLDPERPI